MNKIDVASDEAISMLRARHPDAVFISARTGEGLDVLRARLEERLPRPQIEVRALVPYQRGDLLDKIHHEGEFVSQEHTESGTLVHARVNPGLAGELAEFSQ